MSDHFPPGATLLRRLRRRLKATLMGGPPGRDGWQQPDRVVEALTIAPGSRVADVGAGGGYFTFRLARAVGEDGVVYAVDTDPDMLTVVEEEAHRRGAANVVTVASTGPGVALPEAVELVLLVNAFHHLDEPGAFLRALAETLAPGGRVAVIEPRPTWWLFGHATPEATLHGTLTAAGLEVVDEHDFLSRQAFLVGRAPA